MANIPSLLYKYRSDNEFVFSILKDHALYFEHPSKFNDLFDSSLYLRKLCSAELIMESLTHMRHTADQDAWDKLSESLKKAPGAVKLISESLKKSFLEAADLVHVLSLSLDSGNLAMWGHYANSNKGVCLGFDRELLNLAYDKGKDVDYHIDIPDINPHDPITSAKTYFCVKSQDWAYEKEVRYLRFAQGCHPFPKQALKKIIFGVKVEQAFKDEVINAVNKFGYEDVTFFQSTKTTGYFGLLEEKLG